MADNVTNFPEPNHPSSSCGNEERKEPAKVIPYRGKWYMDPSAHDFFQKGLALEEGATTQDEAMDNYRKCLELEPRHAGAHVNLGTLYYNRQLYREAEHYYRKAIEAEPAYALAHFDLGNVLDETGRVNEAIESFNKALEHCPSYADAMYNLALAYEKTRQPRKALKWWREYTRYDTFGPWHTHARNQIQKIMNSDVLKIV